MSFLDDLANMISNAPSAPKTGDWPSDQKIVMAQPKVHQMQQAPTQDMDGLARKKGFKNAAEMSAFYQRQREQVPTGVTAGDNRSLLDQALAIHPAYLLQHLLDRWGQAESGGH